MQHKLWLVNKLQLFKGHFLLYSYREHGLNEIDSKDVNIFREKVVFKLLQVVCMFRNDQLIRLTAYTHTLIAVENHLHICV
jgi:hypothetical protein